MFLFTSAKHYNEANMAVPELCKNDIAAVFKRLRGIPSNKVCFDCGAKNPTWASVTFGVFICMDCSAVHRSLGVHLSFVRSTQLDTNWTWLQLRAMQVGGNCNALSFFQQHGCTSTDAQQKYNSRAAQLYREKLHHQASAAMRLHGTKLHIDSPHVEHPHSPEKKEIDFFKEHVDISLHSKESEDIYNGSLLTKSSNLSIARGNDEADVGSNLEAALSVSPTEAQKQLETRKSTIGNRKPAAAKKGLGGKKGLGAQRVHTNFTEIEKEAQKVDQQREQTDSSANKMSAVSNEDEEKQSSASVRLAYKDLSLIQKQTEDRMRHMDPKKAEQLERLGMGLIPGRSASGVAHSAASEMKLITQENPSQTSRNRDLEFEDDFEFLSFTSGPPKYGDSPFLSRSSSDRLSDFSSKGSWMHEKSEKKSTSEMISSQKDPASGRSRKAVSAGSTPVSSSDEAQRKFGNAKAISSEQFFGPDRDSEFERRTNLSRFEGSNCISSEDYFSNGSSQRNSSPTYSGPNLYDIKEGVKDGVTKVAGRLSSLANGVMSSLQRK